MATVSEPQTTIWTASEVIAHFGDIPIARIRTNPPPGHATEADVISLHEHDDRLCELIDGTLMEKAMGWQESDLAYAIGTMLRTYARSKKLGKVFGADGMFRLGAGQIRIPDVAFISAARFAGQTVQSGAFWELGCDLAVEVISPSNTRREMERKLSDYFNAGVQLVWLVFPIQREVAVYTSPTEFIVLKGEDELNGGTMLPGFSVRVADIFAELDEMAE